MSKLIDMLAKAGQQTPSAMGFSPPDNQDLGGSQIVLVVRLLADNLSANLPLVNKTNADAVMVNLNSADFETIDKTLATLKTSPWGVSSNNLTACEAKKLVEKGSDYIVFQSMSTQASLLNEEDLGVITTVTPDISEETMRALSELPIDAIMFSPDLENLPLTFEEVIDLQKVLGLLNKPLLVGISNKADCNDIELLRNIGVAGLILDLNTETDISKIATIRKTIDCLPNSKSRWLHGGTLIPSAGNEINGGFNIPDENDDF